MKEIQAFQYLGDITNLARLVSLIGEISESDWRSYKERKSMGGVAGGVTDTIPLIYDEEQRLNSNVKHERFSVFETYIQNAVSTAELTLGKLSIKQAILARLNPGVEIKRHKDMGPLTARTHRIHIPIVTNDKCIFTIGDISTSLRAGQIWLIDNVGQYHGVRNNGDSPRTHLIIDAR